jgi:DNA-binding LacI/PurR family transcriptional regulator
MSQATARPTLERVALLAGVSRATASRVINGSSRVAAEHREAVLRAVRELGYVPNAAARSLATQRTGSVALVFPEPAARIFSDDPFFPSIVRGVSRELENSEHQLVLMMANSAASHERIERYTFAGHVDGVMIASMHGTDPLPTALRRHNIPVVAMERPLGAARIPVVGVDSLAGAAAAVRHLLDRGRTRIATITGPQDMPAGIDRLAGYRQELRAAKRRTLIAEGAFTRESGEVAMRQLLDDHPDLDAVFAASDLMAYGAMRTLRRAGRRIPEDVAVVGFDDFEVARYTEPQLTTVRQPVAELGQLLARQLVRLLAGEDIEESIILATELVVRESS